jgi:hypothetical protein
VEEWAVRFKTGLAAALAVVLVTITSSNVRGSEASPADALPQSEQDVLPSPTTFDPLVPEIADLEETESVAR